MLICDGQHLPVNLLQEQTNHKIFCIVLLRQYNKDCRFGVTKGLRVHGTVKAQDLLHLRIQKSVQSGHGRGKHGGHGLICGVQGGPGKPFRFMLRRQLLHQQLELVLSLYR